MVQKWWYQSAKTGKMESSFSFKTAIKRATPRSANILRMAKRISKKM
jgi:hypothetical protein